MSFTKDNGISDETADRVMRLGELVPATYDEALASAIQVSENIGAPDIEEFFAIMGVAAFAQIGDVLATITRLCCSNKQLITELFDAATRKADATTVDPALKQHELGRMLAALTHGFIDTEARMRKSLIDGVVNEVAGSLEVLGYGGEGV